MPKLVRKSRSNWQGLVLDYLLEVSEDLSLFNWDRLSSRWIAPLGVIVNVTYWLACAQINYLQRNRLDDSHQSFDSRRVILAWNPSIVSLRLFCIFSPVHAIIIYSCAKNVLILLPVALLSAQNLYLVQLFEQYVQDKQSIYGQVFTEYENKFVQPRVGVMKRDVGVGTRPDDNGVYVEVHTPKVGIVDASKTVSALPRSASLIKMHDWERPVTGVSRDMPMSPNVWAQSSVSQSTRHTVASPIKINGSPAKMFRPAGWGASSTSGSFKGANPFVQNQGDNTDIGGMKRSKTTSSLSHNWD
ncbi:Conserved fungal protein [Taphrina deformans PYCC 5710]|uniref:Conserved fungal protein n=1 Tax=Taphrina deformans (strain PYCC 5710 / ATCC 11124 / CBS 356.35 / IMI 108563 / JCM 9778 / NBRC 8474) TaxID=1097556 RepID=R4XGI8_TAPDE|nr:Conserved fungal protein [Taphrina deformans PYCC 5710]|eukprot:CCG82484.1 Conserved fungal protein [Taphrina deformans PYCC 5710]